MSAAVRSNPRPVSIEGFGNGLRIMAAVAVRFLLELHEDVVPEFEEAVAILIGGARRAALQFVALVVENFRARTAGAVIAHHPEIVVGRNADDFGVTKAGNFFPDGGRLFVGGMNGDEKLVRVHAEIFGHKLPCEGDGVFLEIIAEGEVTHHFEEGVVARGVADIIEVVVLAARADAFLGGGGAGVGAFFNAGEDVLELDHAGVGEHQASDHFAARAGSRARFRGPSL
jgi:hypothetical protein